MIFIGFDVLRNIVVALAIILSILVLVYLITGEGEEE